jgi:hypothetical protein
MTVMEDFIAISDSIDESVVEIDLSNKAIDKLNGGICIKDVGKLSTRAAKHLSKWSGIPKSLVDDLSTQLLNESIKEQFYRYAYSKFRVGFNPSNKDEIIFLQPIQEMYLKYSDVFKPLSTKVFNLKGNPLIDDQIILLTRSQEICPEGESLIVGQQIKVSSINIKPLSSNFMAYRIICQNGLIDPMLSQNYKISTKNASSNFIADVISARDQDLIYFSNSINDFVSGTSQKMISEDPAIVMDDAEESSKIPKKVIKEARVVSQAIAAKTSDYTSSGVPHLENLWMYVNLFTLLCQSCTNQSMIESTQKGAFAWASKKLSTVSI